MTDGPPFSRIVIVGGGKVGRLFARELQSASGCGGVIIDPGAAVEASGAFRLLRQDIRELTSDSKRVLGDADVVMLAVPERIATEAVEVLAGVLRPDALLVETLSVKSPFAASLKKVAAPFEILGVNPMFAPDLGIRGNGFVVVPYAAGARSEAFIGFLTFAGANIARMTSEEHDRVSAVMQAGTHAALLAFGIALRECRYDIAAVECIMPPPHRLLIAMLARLVRSNPEISRDVQCANPYARDVREQLREAHASLEKILASDDTHAFQDLYASLGGLMPEAGSAYAQLCARLFMSLKKE